MRERRIAVAVRAYQVLWWVETNIFVADVSPMCNSHPHNVPGGSLATVRIFFDGSLVTGHLHVRSGFLTRPITINRRNFYYSDTMPSSFSSFIVVP